MDGGRALLETMGRIYDAALAEDAERVWLDETRRLIGAEHVCLTRVGPAVRWWSCSRISESLRPIAERFVCAPLYVDALDRVPTRAALRLSAFVPTRTLRGTDLYQDLIRPLNGGIAAIYAWRQGAELGAITVCRSAEGDRDFSDADLAVLQRLLPHVQNASRIRARFAGLETALAHARAALDALDDGVAIVDGGCRVRHLNAAAQAIVRDADALTLDRGTLRAVKSRDDLRLQGLLRQALRIASGMRTGRMSAPDRADGSGSTAMRIERPLCRSSLQISAAPAASLAGLDGVDLFPGAAVVVVRDPDRVSAGGAETLMHAFGLTRREAELALALGQGLSLSAAAQRLGVTEGTARQYLKSVFAKTGVHRQAELVRLLLHGAP